MAQETEITAETVSDALKMLNGSWQWTESSFSSRGVPPSVKTPASTRQEIVVTFKPDNQAIVFVNSQLAGTYSYTVTRPMDEYLMIRFSGGPAGTPASQFLEEGPLTISLNSMTIAGGYNDAGSNQTFKKITNDKRSRTRFKRTRK